MTERQRDAAEQKAMDAANRIFSNALAEFFPMPPARSHTVQTPSGSRLRLKPGQREYLYYRSNDDWTFCYTPWKDENGDYWTWTYKPVGKGSQSGNALKWVAINPVRSRKRKTACKRAHQRYTARMKKIKEK